MKVIEYLHTTSGGHMRYTRELVSALEECDLDVAILTGIDADSDDRTRAVVAVPDLALKSRTLSWIVNRVATYIKQHRDVIHAIRGESKSGCDWLHMQQMPTLRPSRTVKRLRTEGWRVAITVHNIAPHECGRLDRWNHQRQVNAWSKADLLLVHSPRLVRPLVDALAPRRIPRIEIVPHPVWIEEEVDDVEPSRDFLFFGHLRVNKGVDDYVQALVKLGDPAATIAGSGTPSEVANLYRALRSADLVNCDVRVEFIPEEDVARLFADHRVVVAPYREFAAQSGVTHLALTHGRPVVVTDVGGLGDLVYDFGVGEIVGSAEDLYETMARARVRASEGAYKPFIERARAQLHPVVVARRLIACLDEP